MYRLVYMVINLDRLGVFMENLGGMYLELDVQIVFWN